MRRVAVLSVLLAMILAGAQGCGSAEPEPMKKPGNSLDRAPKNVKPNQP